MPYLIEIKGVKEIISNLNRRANLIEGAIISGLQSAGEYIILETKNKYPDLNVSCQLFPESLQYWIHIYSPLSDNPIIICQWSGKRINVKQEKEVGRQKGKGETSFGVNFNMDAYINFIEYEMERIIRNKITEVMLK